MSDEILIESVRSYRFLYDLKDRYYHDSVRKENAWLEISKKNGMSVSESKKKWGLLRDGYRKALKNRQTRSGQANVPIKKWKFEDTMSFMVPFFAERNQRSNLLIEESQDAINAVSIDTENLDLLSSENSLLSPTSVSSSRAASPPLRPSESSSESTTPQLSETRKQQKQAQPALSQVLQEYLGERKQSKLEKKTDHIKKFFESMEETVRTFPPLFQIEVKTKIYNLVTEYEYKTLIRNENRPQATETSHNLQPPVEIVSETETLNNLQSRAFQHRVSHTKTFHNLQPSNFQQRHLHTGNFDNNLQSSGFQQTVSQWQTAESTNKVNHSNSNQSPCQSPENLSTIPSSNQQLQERSYDYY